MDISLGWAIFFFIFGGFNTFIFFKFLSLSYRIQKLESILEELVKSLDTMGINQIIERLNSGTENSGGEPEPEYIG